MGIVFELMLLEAQHATFEMKLSIIHTNLPKLDGLC